MAASCNTICYMLGAVQPQRKMTVQKAEQNPAQKYAHSEQFVAKRSAAECEVGGV